jgi:hypothetical protein
MGGLPRISGGLFREGVQFSYYLTDVLSHDVHVNPERERAFERAAARALLLEESTVGGGEEVPA